MYLDGCVLKSVMELHFVPTWNCVDIGLHNYSLVKVTLNSQAIFKKFSQALIYSYLQWPWVKVMGSKLYIIYYMSNGLTFKLCNILDIA